jgi:hypothetical protein
MASTENRPRRLEIAGPYKRLLVPTVQETRLPPPGPIRSSFLSALSRRRSADAFTSISFEDLATWLHYTAILQAVNAEDSNRQRRFVASFGALHPAHIVLGKLDNTWSVYVPQKHALGDLDVDASAATALRADADSCFATNEAMLVALISDHDLASNYYDDPLSLILRDGGVLLGHAALVAAALGLAFRILGSTGTSAAEGLLKNLPFKPVAAGLAWIGGGGTAQAAAADLAV